VRLLMRLQESRALEQSHLGHRCIPLQYSTRLPSG
jgi:hypothetical protein